jgi:hypothetical protein
MVVDDIISRLTKVAEETHMEKDAMGNMIPMGAEGRRGVANIKDLQDTIASYAAPVKIWDVENGVEKTINVVPAEKMRHLRQYFDSISAKAGRFEGQNMADQSVAAAHSAAADSIREELAKVYPDIAAINKEYSFWKDLSKVTQDTILRKTGHGDGISKTIMGAAGFAKAGVPGKVAMETLDRAAKSTIWRTVSAVQKNKLADALAKGNRGEAERIINQIGAFVTSATARNRKQPEKEQE